MWPTLHFFFRRIHVTGSSKVPKGIPLILISNHSASFLDAMLIAVETDRPVHFYARGDVFRNIWVSRVLSLLNMVPIFTPDHGKANMLRNRKSFDVGERILRRRGTLLIFPEGVSRLERVILPLKKGAARVALQTEAFSSFKAGLQVIPVGINYSSHAFRSEVLLCYGEATRVDTYGELYSLEPAKAVNKLTADLESKFNRTILAVKQPDRSELLGQLIRMMRNDKLGNRSYEKVQFLHEKSLCETLSGWDDPTSAMMTTDGETYLQLLSRYGLQDRVVSGRVSNMNLILILLLLGLPFAVAGWVLNAIPMYSSKWLADQTVTRGDFYTSVVAAAGGFSYLIWWILIWTLAAMLGNTYFRILILTAPLLAFFAIFWWEEYEVVRARWNWKKLEKGEPEKARFISSLRSRLAIWAGYE